LEIDAESAVPLSNLKLTINLAGSVGGGAGDGGETARQGVAAVDALGSLPGFEDEALKAVVGSSPGLPPNPTHVSTFSISITEGFHHHTPSSLHRRLSPKPNVGWLPPHRHSTGYHFVGHALHAPLIPSFTLALLTSPYVMYLYFPLSP